jgi:DNA-binding response OmpR family regulator
MNRTSTGNHDTASVPPKRPLHVVIVDDNRDIVLTMSALLRVEGHHTRACYNGIDVLRCVTDFDADVVLLDVGLPGMNGWDVAREVRNVCGDSRPMIIGMTGEYTKGADKILAEMLGFDYYLVKPADPKVLLALLEKARHPG